LRRSIGYVGRDPAILKGTIKENLLMAKPDATDADMAKVLKDVGAWGFLKSGLGTAVGGPSAKFSGG
jgi:ABC-type transport system involved in cytochrome bd biosynthesis fused ATPase/permease subunit